MSAHSIDFLLSRATLPTQRQSSIESPPMRSAGLHLLLTAYLQLGSARPRIYPNEINEIWKSPRSQSELHPKIQIIDHYEGS